MKLKCKHLIDSTKGWPVELYLGCLQLEVFVENLEDVEITNSLSDFQPSYYVFKKEGNRKYILEVNPRVRNGKIVYIVRDYINKVMNRLESETDQNDSDHVNMDQLGGYNNPYVWGLNKLQRKIENINMKDGYVDK